MGDVRSLNVRKGSGKTMIFPLPTAFLQKPEGFPSGLCAKVFQKIIREGAMTIQDFFSINTVFFAVLGYPMSYIEFFGTIFNIACVWLVAKNKISNWAVGIVGIVLYIFLFYQIRLYSDLFEQIYFLVMSFVGWYIWLNPKKKAAKDKKEDVPVTKNSRKENVVYGVVIALGTVALGYFVSRAHLLFPSVFPEAASFPYLDAFTTVMSFAATILMAKKRVESWPLWILVDVIGIGLYFVKGVKFISLEYVLFLVLAINGLVQWRKMNASQTTEKEKEVTYEQNIA